MSDPSEDIIFEVGQLYRNELGWYRVLEIIGDKIRVQYETDGRKDSLGISLQRRIISRLRREESSVTPIAKSREAFFSYVDECNKNYRSGHDVGLYKEIIRKHRTSGGLDQLLKDHDFYVLIVRTLEAWNMDQRGAELASVPDFEESTLRQAPLLLKLCQYDLSSMTPNGTKESTRLLKQVFCGLKVMESKRKIVGVSKALHFLLPDLVMPIDGTYTLPYFYGYNKYDNTEEQEFRTFEYIFGQTAKITARLALTANDVDGHLWGTSVPKVIDDAIIGFFCRIRHRLGMSEA